MRPTACLIPVPMPMPSRLRSRACLIEPLENRLLLAQFANGIDSNNLGKGMWAWTLSASMTNDGFSTTNFPAGSAISRTHSISIM